MPFDLTRSEAAAYTACCVLVVLLGWRVLRLDEGSSSPVAAGATPSARTTSSEGATVSAAPPRSTASVVHVVGAVHDAGVYRLGAGKRVEDAIARAGGATGGADLQAINLAAKLADGQQIVVPRKGRASAGAGSAPAGAGAAASSGPVNLNSATAEQLDTLDGVGPATAQKILEYRQQHGGFSSVDDLSQIPGIGPKKLEALRAQVTA